LGGFAAVSAVQQQPLLDLGGGGMNYFEYRFELLVAVFEFTAKQDGEAFKQFILSYSAPGHGIPRGEMRRLFKIWTAEKAAAAGGDENA
jgi:hypothetical protein